MLAWILYATCVALLLGVAALLIERILHFWRRATRWVWMTVLVAAVVVPASISFVAIELPIVSGDDEEPALLRLREATAPSLSPQRWVAEIDVAQSSHTDEFLRRAWWYCSLGLTAICLLLVIHWSLRARQWSKAHVAGERVLISADIGPAVVGFMRPQIVLPRWLLDAQAATVDAVLAHEREHLRARDPQLLFASILFICAMPWNLPLWWVVARLRRAIEIDCDARVLRDGRDAVAYGTLLLDVHQQRVAASLTAVALTERPSFLETRIRLMLATHGPQRRWNVAGLAAACAVLIAVAMQLNPPDLRGNRVVVDEVTFDRLTGYYHFGGLMVMHVRREGTQRFAQLSGQRAWSMDARGKRVYSSATPATEYEFVTDADGNGTRVELRQNGNAFAGRRVSDAIGRDIQRSFAAKIDAQSVTPGIEEALRRVLAELQAGRPDYSQMMPALARSVRGDLEGRRVELASYGKLQSLDFVGVTPAGSDVFKATFERGANEITARLAPDGRLTRLAFDEWQSSERRDREAERYQRQQPLAGSARALERLIAALRAGDANEADLSPGMAAVVDQQRASLQLGLASFGALQSITFDRVAPNGWDVFSVRFERAVIQCSIELREDGKVSGVLWDM